MGLMIYLLMRPIRYHTHVFFHVRKCKESCLHINLIMKFVFRCRTLRMMFFWAGSIIALFLPSINYYMKYSCEIDVNCEMMTRLRVGTDSGSMEKNVVEKCLGK